MVSALDPKYLPIFSVLERAGFTCSVDDYRPDVFGNFVVLCSTPTARIKVTNDRGQVFVAIAKASGPWTDKETMLENLGVPRARHETKEGLWSGYDPAAQAAELELFLPRLLAAANNGAA